VIIGIPQSSRIFVVGVCRNVTATIAQEVKNLENAIGKQVFKFYIVESDSSDNTVALLAQLYRNMNNFAYTSLGNLEKSIPVRTSRIAHCRNAYMDFLDENAGEDDYVVVADLDGANQDLTKSRFKSIWERTDWDACTANQKFAYFDIWALRAHGWSEVDWMAEYNLLIQLGMRSKKALWKSLYSKMIRIDEKSDWIPVDSAFGGLGIYKFRSIRGLRYQGEINGVQICEHVPFNAKLKENGNRIFIVPGLINSDHSSHTEILKKSVAIKTRIIQTLEFITSRK
jgi:hypothetical protein